MSAISNWWGKVELQLKLQILIQGFLIIILVAAQQWILYQFEHQVLNAAEERAKAVADGAINGLNTLMVSKAGEGDAINNKERRLAFVQTMGASEKIKEIRVIRAKQLDAEYPGGLPEEQPVDDMDHSVLASGISESRLVKSGNGDAGLRTVVPFIGKKNFRSINCLECHGVAEGAVLGAASVTIDIKDDMAVVDRVSILIWIGQGLLQILLFFGIGFIVRRLLKQLGGEPADVIAIVKRIAEGNLSGEIVTQSDDSDSLLAAVKQMQNDLRALVSDIQTAVDAAIKGDFTRQADLSGKQGFGREIGQSLNTLSGNLLRQIGGNPADAVLVASRIAEGDLSGAVKVREGDTQSILAAMASMRINLSGVIAEVQEMVNAAAKGDFSRKMDSSTKQGYSKTLSELLNRLSDVTETGLRDTIRVAQAIAQGDLTQKVDKDYPGLFGQLKEAINTTVDRLQDVIKLIRDATETVNAASHEIAGGNQDLSNRTEEQASSLEETATSMDEINATVRNNAETSKQANDLARNSNLLAVSGGDVVRQVMNTMSGIQTSSKKIADIVGVIDSIAFQTNILALNAAVEAARAGEQGRGFAVVATEVRNLAQRSATAAKEIKALIEESLGEVDSGVKLASEAGDTMDDVVTSFDLVANLVTEIANASREQSAGLEQVTKAVSQMDEVTQQNAALVEQAAAAAESLEEQARDLAKTVSMFKLAEGGRGRTSPAPVLRDATPRQLAGGARPQGRPAVKKMAPPYLADAGEQWEEF